MSLVHSLTLEPGHPLTLEPGHPLTLHPGHSITLDPGHPLTLEPGLPLTLEPGLPLTLEPGHPLTLACWQELLFLCLWLCWCWQLLALWYTSSGGGEKLICAEEVGHLIFHMWDNCMGCLISIGTLVCAVRIAMWLIEPRLGVSTLLVFLLHFQLFISLHARGHDYFTSNEIEAVDMTTCTLHMV